MLSLLRMQTRVRPLAAGLVLSALAGCAGNLGSDAEDLMHVSCLEEPRMGRCGKPTNAAYYDYRSDTCRVARGATCDRDWPFPTMRDCVEACGGRPQR